jgi:hypothetical protein
MAGYKSLLPRWYWLVGVGLWVLPAMLLGATLMLIRYAPDFFFVHMSEFGIVNGCMLATSLVGFIWVFWVCPYLEATDARTVAKGTPAKLSNVLAASVWAPALFLWLYGIVAVGGIVLDDFNRLGHWSWPRDANPWLLLFAFAVPTTLWCRWLALKVAARMHATAALGPVCPHCGYDLRGTSGDTCPECGKSNTAGG